MRLRLNITVRGGHGFTVFGTPAPSTPASQPSVSVWQSEDSTNVDEVQVRFQSRFGDLRERCGRLSAALREVARGLSENGRVPGSRLIGELRQFQGDFRDLQSQCRSVGDPAGTSDAAAVEVASLADLEREFECRMSVRGALALLDRLDAIRLTDERDAAHWQRCLSEGRVIRGELAASPSSLTAAHANRLLSNEHPLGAVAALIADRDELNDKRWWALHDVVMEAYGRDLVTAIVRQRLTMPSAEAGAASTAS